MMMSTVAPPGKPNFDGGGRSAAPSPKVGELFSKGPIRVPRGASPDACSGDENRERKVSAGKMKTHTTASPLSAAQMDHRRPLSASNTPARRSPSLMATPTQARDALDAVLEAVLDVLLMEHVLELEEEQSVPFAWHSAISDLAIPKVYDSEDEEDDKPHVGIFCGACVSTSFLLDQENASSSTGVRTVDLDGEEYREEAVLLDNDSRTS